MQLIKQLDAINEEASLKAKEFNIFSALHKEHNERYLHSRFIAYLLSPKADHWEGDKFLKLFFNEALGVDFDGFEECEVFPTPDEKSEHKNIDIYICAESKRKAIIIENKIYAIDSNHEGVPQLVGYFDKIKEELKSKLNDDEAKENIMLVYLTLTGKQPSLLENFDTSRYNLPKLIDYPVEIVRWLELCAGSTENAFLKQCIEQYKTLVTNLTSDVKRAKKLQKIIGDNIDQAWLEQEYIRGMANFKHVKWHTIADFWNELSEELGNNEFTVIKRMSVDDITKVAHDERQGSFSIVFTTPNGTEWYVANDKNGLTFGKIPDRCEKGEDWFPLCDGIIFAKFDNEQTFRLINGDHRKKTIKELTEQIKQKIERYPIPLCSQR
jgi:hypothetical protein